MTTITVKWNPIDKDAVPASKTINIHTVGEVDHIKVCELVFRDTNMYQGNMWNILQPLPEHRPHTALSVGDEVIIDGTAYRCENFGFAEI
jgi:hypothetical protein